MVCTKALFVVFFKFFIIIHKILGLNMYQFFISFSFKRILSPFLFTKYNECYFKTCEINLIFLFALAFTLTLDGFSGIREKSLIRKLGSHRSDTLHRPSSSPEINVEETIKGSSSNLHHRR